jgi:2-amino-4-hydroxy-6-hydroxymethyldihydropteridine diphosphokinase
MKTATTTEAQAAPVRVVLLLGSNVDADIHLDAAVDQLRREFTLVASSSRHPSAASGIDGAPPYLNQAVLIEFDGSRDRLKPRLRAIEARLGRVRPSPDPRLCPIDIDAIGRCDAEAEVWDEKAYAANYARQPLAELGKFCTLP